MPKHRSFRGNPRDDGPDLKAVFKFVSKEFVDAVRVASEALTEAGISHALIGGMAVGAYGYQRVTNDVDFLVSDAAFNTRGLVVTINPKVPIAVGEINVDPVSIRPDERWFLAPELEDPEESEGIPIIGLPALIYLKVSAGRKKDREDVQELARRGVDMDDAWTFIEKKAPKLLDRLGKWLDEVDDED